MATRALALALAFATVPAHAQEIIPSDYQLPPGWVELRPGVISTDARDIPPPVPPTVKREIRRLEIAAGVLDIADAASTCHLLSKGGTEQNPILRVLIGKRPACWKVIAAKGANIGLRRFLIGRMMDNGNYRSARLSLYVSGGLTAVVVGINVSQF